jgi:Mg-chelatase subunit ChlD
VQGLDPDGYTNISKGMTIGRTELENHGRFGAAQLMVLLTDGLVNKPTSESVGRNLVVSEANKAAAKNLPVVTISFSSEADPTLMQQVADITNTVHFHIVGSVESQEEDLKAVFLKVAANHPLQLVE